MTRRNVTRALTVVSFCAVAWSMYHVLLIGSCQSNPPPGIPDCPPEVLLYDVVLVGGLLLGIAMVVMGRAAAFVALFAAVGAGGLAAGLRPRDDGGQTWFLVFGLIFLGGPFVVPLAMAPFARRRQRRDASVRAGGLDAVATVLDVSDTGVTINAGPRVLLRLRVEPAAGEPYETETETVVSRLEVPRRGERFAVRVDPADPRHWVRMEP